MKKVLIITITVLISLSSHAYNVQDVLSFLACFHQPTHVVTGEPLFCNEWDLDNDDDVDCEDLLILLQDFG